MNPQKREEQQMKWPWQKSQEPELLRPSGTATISISIVNEKDAKEKGKDQKDDGNAVLAKMEPQGDDQAQPRATGKKPLPVAKGVRFINHITKEVVVMEGDRVWREPYTPPKNNNK